MVRYVLECPKCLGRFELKKYVPEKRVRCRKCEAVVIVPREDGGGEAKKPDKPLDPRLRKKLIEILSLKKLACLSLLLAAALAGGLYILVRRGEARAQEVEKKPEERITLENIGEFRRKLAYPLGRGFSWEYATPKGPEVRKVVLAAQGPEGEPEFEVAAPGSRQTLRVKKDGVYLVSEVRTDGGTYAFTPPLLLVRYPLYYHDKWTYEGACGRAGGAAERWSLEFDVTIPEHVETPAGKMASFKVLVEGTCGGRKVKEVLWYANGVGLVKRASLVDGKVEETVLTQFTQK
jgi:hypothetical protein